MSIDKKPKCPDCKKTDLKHLHNEAHGLAGTHMVDSERYECDCGKAIYVSEGSKLGFKFFYR